MLGMPAIGEGHRKETILNVDTFIKTLQDQDVGENEIRVVIRDYTTSHENNTYYKISQFVIIDDHLVLILRPEITTDTFRW